MAVTKMSLEDASRKHREPEELPVKEEVDEKKAAPRLEQETMAKVSKAAPPLGDNKSAREQTTSESKASEDYAPAICDRKVYLEALANRDCLASLLRVELCFALDSMTVPTLEEGLEVIQSKLDKAEKEDANDDFDKASVISIMAKAKLVTRYTEQWGVKPALDKLQDQTLQSLSGMLGMSMQTDAVEAIFGLSFPRVFVIKIGKKCWVSAGEPGHLETTDNIFNAVRYKTSSEAVAKMCQLKDELSDPDFMSVPFGAKVEDLTAALYAKLAR